MIKEYIDSSKKGQYCELLVLARLIREGYDIAIPYGNQVGWDLLVEVDGNWEKLQVKSVRKQKTKYKYLSVNCSRRRYSSLGRLVNKQYKRSDFNSLIAVDSESGRMWKIPYEDIKGRSSISLNEKSKYRWYDKEPSEFFILWKEVKT